MKAKMPDIEQRILAVLQKGLPRSQIPYKDLARQVGIDTAELLSILRDWKEQGKIRRIGAIVNHFKAGIGSGAMVVWQVEHKRTDKAGRILADFNEVTHAYQRNTCENWPYNVYTMVHGKSRQEIQQLVQRMSRKSGVSNYRILFTDKELKKVLPTYITE